MIKISKTVDEIVKNQILTKLSNLMNLSNLMKMSNLMKVANLTKTSNFAYHLLPHHLPLLVFWKSIFSVPKTKNAGIQNKA